MANRIRGITIEIDGNTTKLEKSLSGVNKDLRTTQSALRDVNKLLKLDPTNTELLKQKQDLLKRAIEDTKKKLDTEKEALKQLKNADQTPEIVAQQQALERQIADDENALKGLKSEFKDVKSVGMAAFSAIGDQVKEVGKKVTAVGQEITQKVTVPIAAIGAASIAASKDVDDGYDEMIKKTGATGDAADELRKIMNNLATEIPTDFKTAGNAVGEVSTRFGVTGDKLEQLSGKFIKFADLNNTDVSTSIDKVQKAMAAYGLDIDDAEGYLDRLNITGQETGVSVDKLADGIVANAAAFQEMGLSVDEATSFMGQLEKSGANSETVLNGMRKALKNATKEGKPLDQALAELQNTIKNGTGSMDGLTAAYDLFGKSGDQIYAAIQNGTLDFEKLGAAISDAGGNIEDTFAETLDPIDKFKTTLNQLKIVGADVGGRLLETLTPMLEKAGEFITKIQEKWESLSPETQEMIVKIGLIAAAIGPIITILGTLITSIGALMSPIGLVVVAIAGAIAAGVALYKNWDKICEWAKNLKDKVIEAWNKLKEKVTAIGTAIKDKVTGTWNTIKGKVTGAVDGIKTAVTNKFNGIKTTISNVWQNIKSNTQTAWSNIKNTVQQNGGGIKGVLVTYAQGIQNTWSNLMGALDRVTGGKLSSIAEWFKSKFGAIWDFMSVVKQKLANLFNFQWHLPKFQLPHFRVNWHDLGHGIRLPGISVDWYKKAYDTPYLFTDPTVVNGRGFGDGGGSGEIVYGRDQLMRDIAEATSGEITINVYASEGMNVNQLADRVSERLAFTQRQKRAAYA